MSMTLQTNVKATSTPAVFSTPVQNGLLQRKCPRCGTFSQDNERKDELEKRLNLQRRSTDGTGQDAVPPVVHEVLSSSGQSLDPETRAFMEPRFGHDFSKVRVHTGERAEESAQAVDALAYTVGQHVIFRTGQYAPQTMDGKILLAHELAHTIQQGNIPISGSPDAGILAISAPSDSLEQAADKIAVSTVSGQPVISQWSYPSIHSSLDLMSSLRIPALLQRQKGRLTGISRNVPLRGTNPAGCMLPLCDKISQPPLPRNDDELRQRVKTWLNASLGCVRNGAAGSNASHSAEIQANNEIELQEAANSFILDINGMSQAQRIRYRHEAVGWLQDICRRRYREAKIEFHYNVVFENPPGGLPWGYSPAEWDDIEGALAGLPAEATWMNPLPLRFQRQECHPDDVDSNTGQCRGRGTGVVRDMVGGQTDTATGQITIFNAGLGQTPYGRSRNLDISATSQTLRHEVGHVVISQVPQSDKDDFFNNIIHWHDYPWAWIIASPAPFPTWQAERNRLRTELKLDESQLNVWLSSLAVDVPVVRGPKTYTRRTYTLQSYETSKVPGIKEFEYARTNPEEYLAELYALAVSLPEFLHSVLPAVEIAWLKRKVFRIPEDQAALALQTALSDPAQTEFIIRGSRLFTWEQLVSLMNELLVKYRQPQARLA